jgi:hypothetical protein
MPTSIKSRYQKFYDRLLQAPEYLGLPSKERQACKRFVLLAADLGTETPPAEIELEAAFGPAIDEAERLVARGALTLELADLVPATEGAQADASEEAAIRIHPAAEIFPMMSEAALNELAEDIKANGLQHPIVRHEGQVIDGRNRLTGCQRAGVQPTFIEWSGTGSVVAWILSTNHHRRHLTDQQRAMVAGRVAAALAIEGREKSVQNLRQNGTSIERLDPGPREEAVDDPSEQRADDSEKNAPGKHRQNGTSIERLDPGPLDSAYSATKAAKHLNVSRDAANKAAKILRDGDEQLVQAVTEGTVSLDAASEVAKLPKRQQRELVKKGGVKAAAKKLRGEGRGEVEGRANGANERTRSRRGTCCGTCRARRARTRGRFPAIGGGARRHRGDGSNRAQCRTSSGRQTSAGTGRRRLREN